MTCEFPFPADIAEPTVAAPVGDPVPRHLFIPVVPWHEPLPPVIRMRPRREHWLLTPPPARPSPSADLSEPPGFGAMAALSLGTWCLGAALLVVAHLKGWL